MRTGRKPAVTAAILAGGASRRMGRDKALVEIGGATMIERVINAVKPAAGEIIIISDNAEKLPRFGLPVYPDIIRGMGPLSGLYTAFKVTGAGKILLAACDMPFLTARMAQFVISCAGRPGDAVIPVVDGVEQGLFAIYRASAIEKFSDRIKTGSIQFDEFRRGLEKSLIEERELREIDPGLKSFTNINRPEDIPCEDTDYRSRHK